MQLDPANPFADLVPKGAPGVIQGPPKDTPIPTNYEPDPSNPGGVRPIQGGPADPNAVADSLDDPTTTFYAQQVLAGAPMPAFGMGKQASKNREQVMKKVASLAGADGMTGADLARQIAHYKAQQTNIQNLEKQFGTVQQNEQTALANGQQFLDRSAELPSQSEYPSLNSVVQFGQRHLPIAGHQTISAMDAAYNTFVNEYAKVVSGSPSGSGVLSDSARHEAMETIRSNASLSQKKAAFDQMKNDMANRLAASRKVISESYDTIGKKPGYEVPSALEMFNLGGTTPPNDGGNGPSGSPTPGVSAMTPEQQAKDKEFLATNPTPEQYTSFLGGLLNRPVEAQAAVARLKAAKAGGSYSGTVVDPAYQDKLKARIAGENKLGVGESNVDALAMQGGTLGLSDEAAGVGNALSGIVAAPFTGKFDPVGDYRFGRDAERMRIADARQQLGYGGTAIELVSGAASGAPGRFIGALTPLVAARQAGTAGAVGGALAGFGSGEGTDQSITGLGVGALGGYAVGRAAPAVIGAAGRSVARVIPKRFRAPQGMAPDVADAAQAEGVDLIRPMVDPNSISDYGALESNVYSQPIIRGGAARVRGQIEDRVQALGQDGTPLDTEVAGGIIQQGARTFIQRSKGVANTLYNRARTLSGDVRFVPAKAIQAVDDQISALSANKSTNAGEINFLNGLKSDLSTPGGKTIEELRQLRQSLRGRINEQNLGATQAEARAVQALDATQLDAAANLPQGAAAAYRRADSYYRERAVHIDDVLDRFLGGNVDKGQARLSGEQAFSRLKSMTSPGGDGRRLAGLMRDLEPNERQDIAATIAQSLGRRSPDEPFSTALFVSQTSKLSPSARRTIFGPDGAQSIENLRLLSRKLEEAGKDINRSRSATVLERQGIRNAARAFIAGIAGIGGQAATGSISGGAAGLAAAGLAMGGSAARRVLSARAMVNPRVSRWLAESADASTPAQAKEATRKLGVIIAREPAIAHELKPIYDMLERRVELPLAATPEQGGGSNDDGR